MKNTNLFFILIFSFALISIMACEKATIQQGNAPLTDSQGEWIPITSRTIDDCDDCPIDYCCCGIEIWGLTDHADISVCGFSNGNYLCGTFNSPGTTCPNVAGIGEDIPLDASDNPRVGVCKEKNGVFRIFNNESYAISIRMTCEYDATNPNWTYINIPAHSEVYYSTNSNCALALCS